MRLATFTEICLIPLPVKLSNCPCGEHLWALNGNTFLCKHCGISPDNWTGIRKPITVVKSLYSPSPKRRYSMMFSSQRRASVWKRHCVKHICYRGHEETHPSCDSCRTFGRVQCIHCQKLLAFADFTVEHIIPRSRGGTNHAANLYPACYDCNQKRSSTPMAMEADVLIAIGKSPASSPQNV